MKGKGKILLSMLVVIILLAILLVALNGVFSKDNKEEPKKESEQKELYKEPETKTAELKAITTVDKNIKIGDTIAYYRDGISEIMLDIASTEAYQELYLTLEFRVDGELIDTKVVYATDIKQDEEFKYMIQSTQDLTKTKKWSVNVVDYATAVNAGFEGVVD